MNQYLRRALGCLLCLCALISLFPALPAQGTETESPVTKAADEIPVSKAVTDAPGFTDWGYLFDGKVLQGGTSDTMSALTIEHAEGIGSLYFIFRFEYSEYNITNNTTGETQTVYHSFLHDFVDLEAMFGTAPTSITVSFNDGPARINELYLFTTGETPDFVQKWDAPVEDKTDMILFSTHGDDEQLFFAGLLPYYANALDYQVQVVYLTDHRNNTNQRVHEMLNGLWAVGCTTYPVFGAFDDFLLNTIEETYDKFEELGTTRDDIIEFCVEQIRRFKPLVTIGHDFAGEYAHGQHMVYADCVAAALEISNDATQFPGLAEQYGTWDVSKAYFHLYEENQIIMDWDTPMEELDGMSPFEVTQKLGFPCHESQQWTWFYKWINGKETKITMAREIATYSPCLYGLYRTTVGPDVEKHDFFENLTTYAEQDRIAQEQLEQEQQAQQATETQPAPTEEEGKGFWDWFSSDDDQANQLVQQEAALRQREAQARKNKVTVVILSIGGGLILLLVLYNLWQERERKRRRKRRSRPKMERIDRREK